MQVQKQPQLNGWLTDLSHNVMRASRAVGGNIMDVTRSSGEILRDTLKSGMGILSQARGDTAPVTVQKEGMTNIVLYGALAAVLAVVVLKPSKKLPARYKRMVRSRR